jgi:hypothetical protein
MIAREKCPQRRIQLKINKPKKKKRKKYPSPKIHKSQC